MDRYRYTVRAAIRSPEGFMPRHMCISKGFHSFEEADLAATVIVQFFQFANVDIFDREEGTTATEWHYKDQPEWKIFALENGLTDDD